MKASTLARLEHMVRLLITRLNPETVVKFYSKGRERFLARLKEESSSFLYLTPKHLERKLWGIKFKTPLMNAAGMFKNGECYPMMAEMGAGAYLGGTGTWNPRIGNIRHTFNTSISRPFVPYPRSGSASNFLGLPNDGDQKNAVRVALTNRVNMCPIGWSLSTSPDLSGGNKLQYLIEGMRLYYYAGIDFLEINESCSNHTRDEFDDQQMVERLKYIKRNFLIYQSRKFPIIVKFSNDTEIKDIPFLMDTLFELGFSGVNFGNTSTKYDIIREKIDPCEQRLFDYFTRKDYESLGAGGGVSGRVLKDKSLALCSAAVQYVKAGPPEQEFHVIRTGGIENAKDLEESDRAGISLNQWFTGFWEAFALHGYKTYWKIYNELG